jgi:hypothetical protein
LHDVDSRYAAVPFHSEPRRVASQARILQRYILERAQTKPTLLAILPVPIVLVLRCGACDDEIETVAVGVLARPSFTFDIERSELAGHVFPLAKIRPPNPRLKPTVRAVTGGTIAELAATAFVALIVVFAVGSYNRIQRRTV